MGNGCAAGSGGSRSPACLLHLCLATNPASYSRCPDNKDYYFDLLFFHRKLKRLIAIELKLGKFKAAYKGQIELYLRWLEKYEKEPGEETPLGLILCAGKTSEHIELLQLNKSGIKVAEYMTELPNRELLEQKLHKAVELARKRLEAKPA